MLDLNTVRQVDVQEEVFLSSVSTVPKLERGVEYGRRFILNLKVSGFYTALEQEHDRIVSKSIPSCSDNVCRMIFVYLITQCSIIHIIWNSGRTASTLPLPRSDTSCM